MLVVETETDQDFPKDVEAETLMRLSLYFAPPTNAQPISKLNFNLKELQINIYCYLYNKINI